jgi:polysaccharide export outer membrane protein
MLERSWSWSVFAVATLAAWSVANGAQEAQPPAAQPASPAQAGPQMATPAAGLSDSYVIGPGDKLQIFVWNHPELTISLPVRPDGQISTPLVENMQAAGRTSSELARDLEGKLAEYVRSPTVNVIVTEALSTFSQVRVVGQVLRPQAIPYRQGMTVMDVVLAAGGLNEFAAGNRAKVVRMRAGKQTEIRVRVNDLINKGDMKQNVALQPGDVLVIPQSRF